MFLPISSATPSQMGCSSQLEAHWGALTQVGQSAGQIWPKGPHPIGYTEQWSMDLQYQVGNHSVFEVGYTGVRGRRLMYGNPDLNANQLPTQDLALGQSTLDKLGYESLLRRYHGSK